MIIMMRYKHNTDESPKNLLSRSRRGRKTWFLENIDIDMLRGGGGEIGNENILYTHLLPDMTRFAYPCKIDNHCSRIFHMNRVVIFDIYIYIHTYSTV